MHVYTYPIKRLTRPDLFSSAQLILIAGKHLRILLSPNNFWRMYVYKPFMNTTVWPSNFNNFLSNSRRTSQGGKFLCSNSYDSGNYWWIRKRKSMMIRLNGKIPQMQPIAFLSYIWRSSNENDIENNKLKKMFHYMVYLASHANPHHYHTNPLSLRYSFAN